MTAAKTETLTVVQALSNVMADISHIGKNRANEQQRFMFRGIDDVQNAMHGPLHKHGVIITPLVKERIPETRATKNGGAMNVVHLRVEFTAYGPAGDSIVVAETWGEAQDAADKATNKALSAAYKYAMLELFCIPTEDSGDADATTIEAAPPRRDERMTEPPVGSGRPAQPDVKAQIIYAASQRNIITDPQDITPLLDHFVSWSQGTKIADANTEMLGEYLGYLNAQALAS